MSRYTWSTLECCRRGEGEAGETEAELASIAGNGEAGLAGRRSIGEGEAVCLQSVRTAWRDLAHRAVGHGLRAC